MSGSKLRPFPDFGRRREHQGCGRVHAFRTWNKIRCAAFEADVGKPACADDMLIHRRFHSGAGRAFRPPSLAVASHGVSRRFAG